MELSNTTGLRLQSPYYRFYQKLREYSQGAMGKITTGKEWSKAWRVLKKFMKNTIMNLEPK